MRAPKLLRLGARLAPKRMQLIFTPDISDDLPFSHIKKTVGKIVLKKLETIVHNTG